MQKQARKLVLFAALAAALSLSACDASTPSKISMNPIRLKEQDAIFTLDAANVDAARVVSLSDDYLEKGRGPVSLTLPYPAGASATAVAAARADGEAWQKAFARHGIANVALTMVPLMPGEPGAGTIVMRYKALAALPPKDCVQLPGHLGADTLDTMDKYAVGCETNTAVSKMIADPSDLEGKGGTQRGDSRRAGAVVEKNKAGTPNEHLKGYTASTVGQSQ